MTDENSAVTVLPNQRRVAVDVKRGTRGLWPLSDYPGDPSPDQFILLPRVPKEGASHNDLADRRRRALLPTSGAPGTGKGYVLNMTEEAKPVEPQADDRAEFDRFESMMRKLVATPKPEPVKPKTA